MKGKGDFMQDMLQHVVGKISSYNIFNNLYPGVIFCYLLKLIFNTDILLDDWFENLFVCYFMGMVLSRVGSVVIEPLLKIFKTAKKQLIKLAPYSDYEKASAANPFVVTLNEERNTYRSLLSCFVCLFTYKIILVVNEKLVGNEITYIRDNKDWIVIVSLMILFFCSFVKQTNYVKRRVELVKERVGSKEQSNY